MPGARCLALEALGGLPAVVNRWSITQTDWLSSCASMARALGARGLALDALERLERTKLLDTGNIADVAGN
jgi:hypothetical protein